MELQKTEIISIGVSKMAWEPTWSPDGKHIAFVDDDTRIRVVNLKAKTIKTIDNAGNNLERGRMGITWSPDSNWLAYAKSGDNSLKQIKVWSLASNKSTAITESFCRFIFSSLGFRSQTLILFSKYRCCITLWLG